MNKKFITNGALVLLSALSIGFIAATIVLIIENNVLSDDLDTCDVRVSNCEQSGGATVSTTVETPVELIDYRLPDSVKPVHYELYLHPDITTREEFFLGKVSISLEILKRTDTIILHSHNSLKLENVALEIDSGVAEDQTFEFLDVTEFLVVSLKDFIDVGAKCKLHIDYSGTLKDKLVGFYSSQYLTEANTMKGGGCQPGTLVVDCKATMAISTILLCYF